MKTKSRIYSLLLLVGLLSVACQREEDLPAPDDLATHHDLSVPVDSSFAASGAKYGCFTRIIPAIVKFNYSNFDCYTREDGSICYRPATAVEINCIYLKIPDLILGCPICGPFQIAKLLPRDIFVDFRKINPEIINLKANGVMFPLTGSVVGLQFYTENKIINRNGFILRKDLLLTLEEQKALGVTGKKIPAGKYPVIHNPQNNTFNAIVAVK